MLSDPDRLIRWVMRAAIGERDPLPEPDAWLAGIESLRGNRLTPLAALLLGPGLERLPESVQRELRQTVARARYANLRILEQYQRLVPALNRSSIPWIILKGMPLACRLYPDPVCRPARDIDLLAPPYARAEVERLLLDLGYSRAPSGLTDYHVTYRRTVGRTDDLVELHWAIESPSARAPATEALLAARQPCETPAGAVWVAATAPERDLLVRHYVRHSGWQAILLLDLLLHVGEDVLYHPLGAVPADDARRLGLPHRVSGPADWRLRPLRRWLARHPFAGRRLRRRAGTFRTLLALRATRGSWLTALREHLWPTRPSERWERLAGSTLGRWYWRPWRLLTFGRWGQPGRHPGGGR
ncbi:MAG: nucleotidyltransferase family protein [Gemmatimonadales bacterium]